MNPKKTKKDQQLNDLKQQVGELTETLQRERADIINIRRQHEDRVSGLKQSVKVGVIKDLLPVVDNLQRALKHAPKELQNNDYVKGVQGVVKQFEKTFSELGVERIKSEGEAFDPTLHEAVGMEDGDGELEVVCEELQAGYRIDRVVIRPAMVKVRREPARHRSKAQSKNKGDPPQ